MDISHGISIASLFLSLAMGAVSFASPCILPLIPSYVSYITGLSFDELVGPDSRKKNIRTTLLHSLVFVAGFTLVFVILGATASVLGQMMIEYLKGIRIVGGILLIVLGLFVTDIIPIPFLQQDAKLRLKERPAGFIGTFLVGVIFAAGWTPCTGPFLAAVLMQAAQSATMATGMVFLVFYSLGIGIPFILSAIAISAFLSTFSKVRNYFRAIKLTSGAILIIMGILLITDKWTLLTSLLMNP
ncbi:MAG: sulfite exporter TauE/SafE family protein [Nitrospiraceae bacterium]|nr:sulfite exporter TauE/SafE family protein [Nitrospiraceae bacterium]